MCGIVNIIISVNSRIISIALCVLFQLVAATVSMHLVAMMTLATLHSSMQLKTAVIPGDVLFLGKVL